MKTQIKSKTGRRKYRTGYCQQGHCEGTKFKSPSGVYYPTCKDWETCPCKCHLELDEIFAIAGQERKLVLSSYTPDYGGFVPIGTIIDEVAEARFNSVVTNTTGPLEAAAEAPVVVAAGHTFGDTPTGRKARGRLEYEVLEVCAAWALGVYDWVECTPKLVSEELALRHQTAPPSTGAIWAVWVRWERYGFCEIAKSPLRMLKSEYDFKSQDLDKLKFTYKKKFASVKSAQRRGVRLSL